MVFLEINWGFHFSMFSCNIIIFQSKKLLTSMNQMEGIGDFYKLFNLVKADLL